MPEYKNRLAAPAYIEQKIVSQDGEAVGTRRLKPSGLFWKPKGAQQFYRVSIDKFTVWITDPSTKAGRTKQ